jgi:hypothetical protein
MLAWHVPPEGRLDRLAEELSAPRVDAVSLTLLGRERRLYSWTVLASVPLAAPA